MRYYYDDINNITIAEINLAEFNAIKYACKNLYTNIQRLVEADPEARLNAQKAGAELVYGKKWDDLSEEERKDLTDQSLGNEFGELSGYLYDVLKALKEEV